MLSTLICNISDHVHTKDCHAELGSKAVLLAHVYIRFYLRSGCSCGWGTTLCTSEEGWSNWAEHVTTLPVYPPQFHKDDRVRVDNPQFRGFGLVQYDNGFKSPRIPRTIGVLLENGNVWEYAADTVRLVTAEDNADQHFEKEIYVCTK
jgi:hypothetical protein